MWIPKMYFNSWKTLYDCSGGWKYKDLRRMCDVWLRFTKGGFVSQNVRVLEECVNCQMYGVIYKYFIRNTSTRNKELEKNNPLNLLFITILPLLKTNMEFISCDNSQIILFQKLHLTTSLFYEINKITVNSQKLWEKGFLKAKFWEKGF